MNNVLIIGGAGYIGGYMTDYFLKLSYGVTVYDSLLYETRFLKKVNFIRGDIRDRTLLKQILPRYDTVVLLAAVVGDGACAVNPTTTIDINSNSVRWLADNFSGKIVFTSTCSVYGLNDSLLDEQSSVNPLSLYAETKLEAEQYLFKNRPDSLIFRLGTLYGLGDEHSRIRLDLVANVLAQKAANKETLNVFGGEQWRPLLHVREVAHATDFGIKNNLKGIYNLSTNNITIKELAERVGRYCNHDDIHYTDMLFEDLRNYRVSNQKMLLTGWRPDLDSNIKTGILEIYNTIKSGRITNVKDPVYHNENFLKALYEYN